MNEMVKEKVLRTLTGCVLLLIVIGGLVMMYPNYRRAESLKRQNAELQETIDRKKKKIIAEPQVTSRGFVYIKANHKLMEDSIQVIKDAIQANFEHKKFDWSELKQDIRNNLEKFLYKQTNRHPVVLPVVMEVNQNRHRAMQKRTQDQKKGEEAGKTPSKKGTKKTGKAAKKHAQNKKAPKNGKGKPGQKPRSAKKTGKPQGQKAGKE